MILPAGLLLGPRFNAPTIAPESYDIRLGDQVHALTSDEHTVWSLAHGFPEMVGDQRPSRPIVEVQATQLGVQDSQIVFQRLVNAGLIVPLAVGHQVKAFAELHRAFPLALGLGNSAEDLNHFVIGRAQEPLVRVVAEVFHVWSYLPLFTSIAESVAQAGIDLAGPDGKASTVAGSILEAFLKALPVLLAQNCLYIDRN